jgi:fumarylacetoacetase
MLVRKLSSQSIIMAVKSWLNIPADSHFSIANIPFGIISTRNSSERRPAIAIGDHVLDLKAFAAHKGFDGLPIVRPHFDVFSQPTLNAFASLGRPFHREVRKYLQDVLSENTTSPDVLKNNTDLQKQALIPQSAVTMHLPMHIGDYTDFYAGYNHAFAVGTMFRGPANALQKNYTHLPVGYHGRASSVVVSGTPIRRPVGQVILDPNEPNKPTLTAARRMDIELELGVFISSGNELGERIPVSKAEDSIFGLVLMNDWSARDIQQFEYVPLGPFNGKNFGTTISPWVVLPDALEPFKTKGIENKTEVLSYLKEKEEENVYDIKLQVDITSKLATAEVSHRFSIIRRN